MLINFRLFNFKSFGEAQEFTTIPGKYRSHSEHVFKNNKYKALKFSALFGGNASGKSNLVEAIYFLKLLATRGFVPTSAFNSDITFKLSNLGKQSSFEIVVGIENEIFIYGVSLDIKNKVIEREYLYLAGNEEDKLIYDLEGKTIKHITETAASGKRIEIYVKDLKENQTLLYRLANAKDVGVNKIFDLSKKFLNWLIQDLVIITPASHLTNFVSQFSESDKNKVKLSVIDILSMFDTGITDYSHQELSLEKFSDILKSDRSNNQQLVATILNDLQSMAPGMMFEVQINGDYHQITYDVKEKKPIIQLIKFIHNKNPNLFSYAEESDGTKRLIEIINVLYSIQFSGKTYIIDELERSFHSNLTVEFIEKFLDYSKTNNSQLIVTTHETNILNFKLVRQDELWLIDRNKDGMSSLLPLSSYNVRIDKILDKDYLEGRYGGVPKIRKLLQRGING